MEKIYTNSKDLLIFNQNQNTNWPYLVKLNQFTKNINEKKKYIKLGLTRENNLNIEFYEEEDPINTFHKASLNLTDIQNLNDIFRPLKSINEVYNFIYDILNKENYDIKLSDEQIILVLLIDKNEIHINLKKEKISFVNEYNYELNELINKLYNEVSILKKTLIILSNNINYIIFY